MLCFGKQSTIRDTEGALAEARRVITPRSRELIVNPPAMSSEQNLLKATYGREGQVSGSSRSRMYTVRWICGTISTASTIYAHSPSSIVRPKIEAIAYTRKRQAKQPCLDTEGSHRQ